MTYFRQENDFQASLTTLVVQWRQRNLSKSALLFFLLNLLAVRCGYAELVVELPRKTILDICDDFAWKTDNLTDWKRATKSTIERGSSILDCKCLHPTVLRPSNEHKNHNPPNTRNHQLFQLKGATYPFINLFKPPKEAITVYDRK